MEYNKQITFMGIGDMIEGFYLLKDGMIKTSVNGKSFLSGSVSDRSGSMEIKMWDYGGPVGASQADIGKVVKVRGEVSEYRGSLQLTLTNIRLATAGDTFNVQLLVPTAPIDTDEAMSAVKAFISSIKDDDYRAVADEMLHRHYEMFSTIPAAKSVHHSFLSGLLMHTVNMMRTADFLADLYGDVTDRSLLLTGTMLHDFAKGEEFTFSELGMVTDYSVKGQLLGHLVMGASEVAALCDELDVPEEKSVLLQHMILSHHGEPDFGAAVRPMCAEAELLSFIDLIDSRMEIYAETLIDVPKGSFSGRVFALDKKIYNHG